MSIDRRLRSASNALREVELATPERVPRGSVTRTPALALPALMLVFGAALAVTGLDRTPGSAPMPESAAVFETQAVVDDVPNAEPEQPIEAAYDLDHELQLIRELRRRTAQPIAAVAVTAPDANAELELINSLVSRPAVDSPPPAAPAAPVEPERSRPIIGLS